MNLSVRNAVRDAVAKWFPGYVTVREVEEELKLQPGQASGCFSSLFDRKVLVRRYRNGTGEGTGNRGQLEYTKGPNFQLLYDYADNKLPYTSAKQRHGVGASADKKHDASQNVAAVAIVIPVQGKGQAFSLTEARAIYEALKVIFD